MIKFDAMDKTIFFSLCFLFPKVLIFPISNFDFFFFFPPGVAKAFREELHLHPELEAVCKKYFGNDISDDSPQLKMAKVRYFIMSKMFIIIV